MKKIIFILSAIAVVLSTGAFFIGEFVGRHSVEGKTEYVYEEDKLAAWEMLELSIMKTESEFDPSVIGKTNDIGLMQITPVYVTEVNRLSGGAKFSHIDAFDAVSTLEMFNITQNAKNPDKDVIKAINIHNPGGASIGYCSKVLTNYNKIRKYEEIRKIVRDYHNSKKND